MKQRMGLFMRNLVSKLDCGPREHKFIFPCFQTQYTLNKQYSGKNKSNLKFPDKDFKFDEGSLTFNDEAGVIFEDSKSKSQFYIKDFAEITTAEFH